VENGYIESFNGRLRDECLNTEVFFNLTDVREKLEAWRQDYNRVRPHSALYDWAPEVFASQWQTTAPPAPKVPLAPAEKSIASPELESGD
jgi:putative transposase